LSGQVDNVALALTLLGREGVAGLPAKEGEDGAMNDLVLRARRAAVMAELIAKASGKAPAGTAFTAGLLHGLGSFALAAVDPVSYRQIDPLQAAPAVLEAERRAFGLTFPEVGGSLAARWRLPNGLTQAIRHPFAPDAAGEFRVLAAVTGLAAMVAHAPSHLEPAFLQACGGALGLLGIDAAVVEGLLEEAEVLVTHFEPA
jgi:HD-like signal output (HDOD) protein